MKAAIKALKAIDPRKIKAEKEGFKEIVTRMREAQKRYAKKGEINDRPITNRLGSSAYLL